MFRGNRPLRRAARRILGTPFAPHLRRQVSHALQLAQAGQHEQAAAAFAALSAQALQDGHPRQAANLDAQAAHHYVTSRNEASALAHARSALIGFQKMGMGPRFNQFYTNIQHHMETAGMTSALANLRQEFAGASTAVSQQAAPQAAPNRQVHLPPSCTGCGAPLRSDEVDWVDDQSAECPYCGSIILSE